MVGVAKTDQLGTSERIQEKIEKIKQFTRVAPAVSRDDGAEVQGLRGALRELHQRIEVHVIFILLVLHPKTKEITISERTAFITFIASKIVI